MNSFRNVQNYQLLIHERVQLGKLPLSINTKWTYIPGADPGGALGARPPPDHQK